MNGQLVGDRLGLGREGYPIVLAQPPVDHGVRSLFTFHKNKGIGAKPPQALMILGTCLKDAGFGQIELIDAQLEELSPAALAERIAQASPSLVGLTVWTDFWYPAWETVRHLRKRLPDVRIVLGGPHCSIYPAETLEASDADYVVAGDGELTMVRLTEALSRGEAPGDLPGLWRKREGKILAPEVARAEVESIDSVPIPDRTLLDYRRYGSVLNAEDYETTMITSRGCPHKCVFCKMFTQKVCARSAAQVVEEFRRVAELGIRDIQVYDDTFTWSKQRVMDICNGILDLGLDVRWAIRDRVSKADPEMYALLRKAGCYRIHFGVESGSPPILAASGKGITLEQAEDAVRFAKEAGMDTLAFYMFGFLEETLQDAGKTIDFSKRLDTDYAAFAVLIPYPGTKIYQQAMERGIIAEDFWRGFTLSPEPDFLVPRFIEDVLTREELIKLKNRAQFQYYFRWSRIWRELRAATTPKGFMDRAGMAWNILSDYLHGS